MDKCTNSLRGTAIISPESEKQRGSCKQQKNFVGFLVSVIVNQEAFGVVDNSKPCSELNKESKQKNQLLEENILKKHAQ